MCWKALGRIPEGHSVLQTGQVAVSGLADTLKSDDRVRASYLGMALG